MEKRLVFATSTELVRVPSDTVVYITAEGNYSVVTMADGGNFTAQFVKASCDRWESWL